MLILFDIGNTHTHVGLAGSGRILRQADFPVKTGFQARAHGWPASLLPATFCAGPRSAASCQGYTQVCQTVRRLGT